jgi:hypothetical protein
VAMAQGGGRRPEGERGRPTGSVRKGSRSPLGIWVPRRLLAGERIESEGCGPQCVRTEPYCSLGDLATTVRYGRLPLHDVIRVGSATCIVEPVGRGRADASVSYPKR